MLSLELRALVWTAGDARFRLDLRVARGEVVVVAHDRPPVVAALSDVTVGLAAPVSGAVCRDGRDVTRHPPGDRGIGLVPAGGALLPHLTVERNIVYGAPPAARHRARERIPLLRLDEVRRLRPHELSPAQRLRVAVGRAVCHSEQRVVVLLEDPAGGEHCQPAITMARRHADAVVILTCVTDHLMAGDHPPVRPKELPGAS